MFVIAYNILFLLIAWILGQCIYNIFLHPLRHIPGPLLAKVETGICDAGYEFSSAESL
jgi:hypothetical protein